jgi:beta-lactamase class A
MNRRSFHRHGPAVLAAALALHRVDAGQDRFDCPIRYGADQLLPHSPITARHIGDGMTLAALCDATVTVSDNAVPNLVLESFGGPSALTAYARRLGDTATRLDRWEPELNAAAPGDPRDTTTPQAMAMLLKAAMLGDALTHDGRARLIGWLRGSRTNASRLGAHVPAGWQLGSKTGSGPRRTANDVGVYWTPSRAAIVVAVYLTESTASAGVRDRVIAHTVQPFDEDAHPLERPQLGPEAMRGGLVQQRAPQRLQLFIAQPSRPAACGHCSQRVDAALSQYRLARVRGLARHTHCLRGLCWCLARQQHSPRSQAPPYRLVQSLCRHVLHPILAKYRYNGPHRQRLP